MHRIPCGERGRATPGTRVGTLGDLFLDCSNFSDSAIQWFLPMKFSMELTFENFSRTGVGRDVQHCNKCVAMCNTLPQMSRYLATHCNTCAAVHNILQHMFHYLQHIATDMSLFCNTCVACAQRTATHAPQFATHCNTRVVSVQHTASNMSPCCNTQYRYLATHVSLFAIRCATHCNKWVAILPHTATLVSLVCNTLQQMNRYLATHCNTCVAGVQHTATHALQFATHCNTLQHMCRYFATHFNKYLAIWRGGISKVSLLLNLINKTTTELTFEKFYHQRVRESLGSRNLWCVYGLCVWVCVCARERECECVWVCLSVADGIWFVRKEI